MKARTFFLLVLVFPAAVLSAGAPASAALEKRLQAGGTELNYVDEGSGPGRPVVLIHGSHSSLYTFTFSIFDRVAQRHRAVAFDLSGYGKSKRLKKKMTVEEHVEILHDALKELKIKKPVLVGHSMGGAFVLCYLLKYPDDVSAAVLLAPYTKPFKKIFIGYRLGRLPVIGDLFVWLVIKPMQWFRAPESWAKSAFYPSEVNSEYMRQEIKLVLKRSTFKNNSRDIYALRDLLNRIDSRYGEIKVPVYILAGDSDRIAPQEEHAAPLHGKIKGSEFTVLPRTGHLPAFSKPAEVVRAIDAAGTENPPSPASA